MITPSLPSYPPLPPRSTARETFTEHLPVSHSHRQHLAQRRSAGHPTPRRMKELLRTRQEPLMARVSSETSSGSLSQISIHNNQPLAWCTYIQSRLIQVFQYMNCKTMKCKKSPCYYECYDRFISFIQILFLNLLLNLEEATFS